MSASPDIDTAARRLRLRTLVVVLLVAVAVGVVAGLGGGIAIGLTGSDAGLLVALLLLVLILVFLRFARSRYLIPWQIETSLPKLVDPSAAPPDAAGPSDPVDAQRIMDTISSGDERACGTVLADDVSVQVAGRGRPIGRRTYVRVQRIMRAAYPDVRIVVDEVRVDPVAPAERWVRTTTRGRSHRGRALDMTAWERWTFAPDGRIAEIGDTSIVRFG